MSRKKHIPSNSSGINSAKRNKRGVPLTEVIRHAAGRKRVVPSTATSQPEEKMRQTLVFRFDCTDLDNDCPWSLANVSPDDQKDLLEHLRQYESRTVGELRGGRLSDFKSYPDFADCPNKMAVNRLATHYDATDSIARFRLSGTKRLYGFLVDNEFHLLWWDPNHKVWPSRKRHT